MDVVPVAQQVVRDDVSRKESRLLTAKKYHHLTAITARWWFPWRGSGDDWSFGSQELAILFSNGTLAYDDAAIAALVPYM